eukprot:COSAG02_NODE_4856_length_4899_cov_2.376667_5_plen_142_part_00
MSVASKRTSVWAHFNVKVSSHEKHRENLALVEPRLPSEESYKQASKCDCKMRPQYKALAFRHSDSSWSTAYLTHRPCDAARVDLTELYGIFLQQLLKYNLVLRHFSRRDADSERLQRFSNRLVRMIRVIQVCTYKNRVQTQ